MYTEKEIDLARRYMDGDCNEIQLNYLINTQNLDRSRIEELVSRMSYAEPMALAAKTVLAMMIVHFVLCLAYSLANAC